MDPFPLLPILLAFVLGGSVGLERQWHGRAAGLRTHVIVCLSATLLILISRGVAVGAASETGRVVFDPNRMGAGIVTGIGFLGAATVLRSGDLLRGLTTAACIWFVAGLGIALGNEEYALSITTTALVLFALTILPHFTDGWVRPVIYRRVVLVAAGTDGEALLRQAEEVLHAEGIRLLDVAGGKDSTTGTTELVLQISLQNELQSPRLISSLAALEGVTSTRWELTTA